MSVAVLYNDNYNIARVGFAKYLIPKKNVRNRVGEKEQKTQ